jgi:hypothetical protein
MPVSDDGHFRLTAPDGSIIARGSMSALLERVNQSVPRMNAEAAIVAAAKAMARERWLDARADSLDARERRLDAREDAARAADLQRFVDGVQALSARMDSLEAERDRRALDSLPDPDDACAADFLPSAPLEPSADRDREMIEAQEAIEKERDDTLKLRHEEPDDGDPGQIPATPAALSAIMGKPFEGWEMSNKPTHSMVCLKGVTKKGL